MKRRRVLDAWAVLALIQGEEPAASRVKVVLERGREGRHELFMSIINVGEVVYRIGKVRGESEALEVLTQIRRLPIEVLPATEEAVLAAVRFKIRYAISYADAFAAAAAEGLEAVLMTGDPELVELGDGLAIEALRRERINAEAQRRKDAEDSAGRLTD